MKRVLVCPTCSATWEHIAKHPSKEARGAKEKVTIVVGRSKGTYVCDDCNADIDPGDACAAVSVSSPRTPYFQWETEYLEPKQMKGDENVRAQG